MNEDTNLLSIQSDLSSVYYPSEKGVASGFCDDLSEEVVVGGSRMNSVSVGHRVVSSTSLSIGINV